MFKKVCIIFFAFIQIFACQRPNKVISVSNDANLNSSLNNKVKAIDLLKIKNDILDTGQINNLEKMNGFRGLKFDMEFNSIEFENYWKITYDYDYDYEKSIIYAEIDFDGVVSEKINIYFIDEPLQRVKLTFLDSTLQCIDLMYSCDLEKTGPSESNFDYHLRSIFGNPTDKTIRKGFNLPFLYDGHVLAGMSYGDDWVMDKKHTWISNDFSCVYYYQKKCEHDPSSVLWLNSHHKNSCTENFSLEFKKISAFIKIKRKKSENENKKPSVEHLSKDALKDF